jgi:hypothetical protein
MVRGALFVAAPWVALSFPAPWLVPLVLIVSLLAGALLVRDPEADRGALLMVAAFTVCDLSPFSVEGSVVRLYQLSVVVVLVVLLRRRSLIVRGLLQLPRLPMAAVATIVALTVLTPVSLLWTISPRDTLVSAVGQLSATGLLVLFAATISAGFLKARDVLTAVWAMATSSSLLACLQFTLTVLTPWELASAGGSGVPWPRPEGLMTEAVWAALVAAMGLALAFVVRRDHPHLAYGSLGVNAATLCLVGSRAVLLGMAVGSLVCGVVLWRRHMTPLRLSGLAAAALVGVLGLAVVAPGVLARFDPTLLIGGGSGADGGSAQSRAVVYKLVADELPSLLPLGAGAGSLNKLTTDAGVRDRYLDGGELNAGRGSTNFFLGYAFDFGYLGAALALTLVVVVGVLAFRTARWDHGLSVFLVTLFLIDFQFNNGFRFGFVHVMLAVLLGVSTRHAVRPLALSAGSKASA